ncbi:MAG: von Willebrand factor, type A [archaeon GW2011_AR13]|nr:MAG: von Willebrand factor, type A [archaeon GW2011_AR13]HIH63301.1 DUF58 domain-containing protein [Nanoarchaeota archaeon]
MTKGKLNVDVADAITQLESMIKEFKLKRDIYRLIFRGKGLEFEGFRNYSPDDDASDIDWKASSRAQELLVKQYKEERDLKIVFMLDVGSNMVFGSTKKIKCEYALELIAALANLMLDFNDAIGLILFNDKVTQYIECKKGRKQMEIFMDILSHGETYGEKSNINNALDFATDYLNESIFSVIIISDLLSSTNETEKKLSLLASMFETIVIRVRDPLDVHLPNINGELIIENTSNNSQLIINPKVAKESYEKYVQQKEKLIEEIIKGSNVDYLDLMTSEPFAVSLAIFLKERIENKI